jgi:hypothetical protein
VSSINQQIDAAVPMMKARAAEFDETRSMDGAPPDAPHHLMVHARRNLSNGIAHYTDVTWADSPERRAKVRESLVDAMNLCALALSLLPEEPAR